MIGILEEREREQASESFGMRFLGIEMKKRNIWEALFWFLKMKSSRYRMFERGAHRSTALKNKVLILCCVHVSEWTRQILPRQALVGVGSTIISFFFFGVLK